MSKDEKEPETGFKVTDRRLFTEEGEIRKDVPLPPPIEPRRPEPPRAARPEPPSSGSRQAQPPKQAQAASGQQGNKEELTIDFPSFLLSMATSAMVHMGEVADPMTGRPVENLQAARQTIDILTILREKTKGNLTADEQRLLDGLLYELRLKFLSKSKTINL